MKRLILGLAAALSLGLGAMIAPAEAGTITDSFDQNIPASAGGVYFGSGNTNGGYSLADNGTFTLGLRVKGRQDPNVIDTTDNVYPVPAGAEPGAPTYAWWNYERAIYCDVTTCDPSSIQQWMTDSFFTFTDVTKGTSAVYSALGIALDDDTWTGTSKSTLLNPFIVSAENSENPLHSLFIPGYNMNDNDLYRIEWTVCGNANIVNCGTPLNYDSVYVQVGTASGPTPVPEAPTCALFGAALLGVGFFAWQRKKSTAGMRMAAA